MNMKGKVLLISAVIQAAFFCCPALLLADGCGDLVEVSIYGKDNRMEYCAADDILKTLSESVAAIFTSDRLTEGKDGGYTIKKGVTLDKPLLETGDDRPLGPGERYRGQIRGASCAGSLVGDDLLLTAGHCIRDGKINPFEGRPCGELKVVFGYRVERTGLNPSKFRKDEVYSCKEPVKHVLTDGGLDFAVIRLDRKVVGRKPLAINRKQNLREGTGLITMGYPTGIPLKIADGAKVRSVNKKKGFFMADLDAFYGCSGSPVFNSKTLLIEGIAVRGGDDYEPDPADPEQLRATVYPQNGGPGEGCTLAAAVQSYVPVTDSERDMLWLNAKTKDLYGDMVREMQKRKNQPSGKNAGDMRLIEPFYQPVNMPEPEPLEI